MTFFRRISLIVAFLLMVGIAVGLGYARLSGDKAFLPNAAQQAANLIYDHTFSWVLLLVVVLLLVNFAISVLAVAFEISPSFSRHLTIDGESGQISVALDAVEDFLRRKGSLVSGVKDLHIQSEVSKGMLRVYCRLSLILDRDIPTFSREFQGLLRTEITKTLGVQNIKEIRVIIHRMVTEELTARPAGTKAAGGPASTDPGLFHDESDAERRNE
ncbi:MAG: alkaline shock response membrane anchor protein AmaP [bacterium]